ncbi:hypothetical protein PAPYR_6478 [Paratrimastix pyriformis]|uniref:SET domain-containing protein n=1 Tax=Paratrimastix pyriformis TaxID=342808 RepID=A0ABQ8UF85_9EUKA|nr:hypothetical protein PAPYR_6478 [Paratrimastix pyriformis]
MEVKTFPGLGRAGIAARQYDVGVSILDEPPLLTWKRKDRSSMIEAFDKSSHEVQQKVLDFFCPQFSVNEDRTIKLLEEGLADSSVPCALVDVAKEIADSGQFPNLDYATIFRLLLLSNLNAHSFGGAGDEEMSALFDVASKVPHSCCPNVVYLCNDSSPTPSLCYRSIRPIPKGETLQYSYLCNKRLLQSTNMRRHGLAEDYLFTCRCPRCASEDLCRGLPCPRCHGLTLRSDKDYAPGAPQSTGPVFPTICPPAPHRPRTAEEQARVEALQQLASPAPSALWDHHSYRLETDPMREARLSRRGRSSLSREPFLELHQEALGPEDSGRIWGDGTGGDDCWDLDGALSEFDPSRDDPAHSILAGDQAAVAALLAAEEAAPALDPAAPKHWRCTQCQACFGDGEMPLRFEGKLAQMVLRRAEGALAEDLEAMLRYCTVHLSFQHWATAMCHALAAQQWARLASQQYRHLAEFLAAHPDYPAAHPLSAALGAMPAPPMDPAAVRIFDGPFDTRQGAPQAQQLFDQLAQLFAQWVEGFVPATQALIAQPNYSRALAGYMKGLLWMRRSVAHAALYGHFLAESRVLTDVPTIEANFAFTMGDLWEEWARLAVDLYPLVVHPEAAAAAWIPAGTAIRTATRTLYAIQYSRAIGILRANWGADCPIIRQVQSCLDDIQFQYETKGPRQ